MAHGLPVVVSNASYCGISELLSNGENALLLENPTDSDALALALCRLMGAPLLYKQLSDAGCSFARVHRWGDAAQKMTSIYEALATKTDR